ncbi:MAG: efflux RND transporter periplasmic adaptor subunit [Betaproteobacteria bacterium]|nr:efflux RND transporter periplasmic adaptor subunit [Betaproteobacteria bacterium]
MNWPSRPSGRLLALVALVVVVAGWIGVQKLRGKPAESLAVQRGDLVQSVVVTGRVSSESRVTVGSVITGRVRAVPLREGAKVKAGDLLIQLEDTEQRAAALQADAALKSAEARLASQTEMATPMAEQQLAQARANATSAARERERRESLFKQGFIGQAQLDEARRADEVARAQLRSAEAQATANIRGAERVTAEVRVTEARAAAELARARLAQTRIVAPADALVLERLAEPGQIVQPGTRLMTLSIAGPVQLIAQVDEKYLAQLAVGQPASVSADAYPGQRFAAKVLSVSPTVDTQRGSVEVKFAVAEPPAYLRNDMTLSIEVETGRRKNVLAVSSALVMTGEPAAVLVVNDGKVERRTIKPGLRTLTAVEVLEGIKEGEVLLFDATLAPGTRVRPVARGELGGPKVSNEVADGMRTFSAR